MEEILNLLGKLNDKQLLGFCYSSSVYLIENYAVFSRKYGWGNLSALEKTFPIIELCLIDDVQIPNLIELIHSTENEIPDTNDFSSLLCSFALDSGNCLLETLKFIQTPHIDRAISVATFCTDTVDMYIQEINNMDYSNPNFEKEIAENELMISELKRQTNVILALNKWSDRITTLNLFDLIEISKDTNRPNLSLMA